MARKLEQPKGIIICHRHTGYKVPLIPTFAFRGAEYWCPYCGRAFGIFDAHMRVKETEVIKARKEFYTDKARLFLRAMSTLCCSRTKWQGQMITPANLPKWRLNRLRKLARSWKYKKRMEEWDK